MKTKFHAFYRPDDGWFDNLWQTCLFGWVALASDVSHWLRQCFCAFLARPDYNPGGANVFA